MINKTLFISDLHLHESEPKITQAFLAFLNNEAQESDALYILGDLFEYWIGDRDRTPYHRQIIKALKRFAHDIPTYFMHGNRDFLIGRKFAKQAGIKIIPDPTLIELYGNKILLMHGDSLCTLDYKHQEFRRKTRSPFYRYTFLALPLKKRREIATNIRKRSDQHKYALTESIMDVTPEEVTRIMQHYQVHQLIHGHTHRPNIHHVQINNQPAQRIVLGAWHDGGKGLAYDQQGHFELKAFFDNGL